MLHDSEIIEFFHFIKDELHEPIGFRSTTWIWGDDPIKDGEIEIDTIYDIEDDWIKKWVKKFNEKQIR